MTEHEELMAALRALDAHVGEANKRLDLAQHTITTLADAIDDIANDIEDIRLELDKRALAREAA